MRKPNFMIVGAQKSGTTFLYKHMRQHTDVFFSKDKEPHFFNKIGVNEGTFKKYLSDNFSAAEDQKWIGEASALYLHSMSVASRVERHVGPDVKIIICIRKPVDKAVSLYLHDYRKGRLKGNEPLCYTDRNGNCPSIDRSRYATYIMEFISRFGHDNIKIMMFDDLVKDPGSFLLSAYDFLGLQAEVAGSFDKVNSGFDLVRDGDYLTVSDDAVIPVGTVRPYIPVSELNSLNARLSKDIDATSLLLGRDLSHWKESY